MNYDHYDDYDYDDYDDLVGRPLDGTSQHPDSTQIAERQGAAMY